MISVIKKYRHILVSWGTHQLFLPLIRVFIKAPKFPYSMESLAHFELDSTGRQLYEFLCANGFDLLKNYESHDVKHVLLDYPGSEEGEACMQFFMFGNGQRSLPVISTVIVCSIIMPDYHRAFRQAFLRGRCTPDVSKIDWIQLLNMPLNSARKELQLN